VRDFPCVIFELDLLNPGYIVFVIKFMQMLHEGERRGRGEKKESEGLTGGPHRHVASTSAKPQSKPLGWLNVTGFESWMVKNTRF